MSARGCLRAYGVLEGLSWFHSYSVPLLRETLCMARRRERERDRVLLRGYRDLYRDI